METMEQKPRRKSYLGVARRNGNGEVLCNVLINGVVWDQDPQLFKKLQTDCPDVNISQMRDPSQAEEHKQRDAWGCLWHYPGGYLDGQVVEHPLADWSAFASYKVPDPDKYRDWQAEAENIRQDKSRGEIAMGTIAHGFLYLQLTYLRGFENFMLDLAQDRQELRELRDMVTDFWVAVVRRWLDLGVDVLHGGDDLGHQHSLPMSPAVWREFLKPSFVKIFQPCWRAGAEVYLHTDGWILDIIPDLLEAGVTILNAQDLVNGPENLKRAVDGQACIDLDIDRQSITVFGMPEEIDRHIHKYVTTLGSQTGGLMLIYGAYPSTPPANVAQVIHSMQKYHDYWVGQE